MKSKVYKTVLALTTAFSVFVGSSFCVSAEGLSDVFDADYYAQQNPDVVAAIGSDPLELLNHFITYGVNEGRQGMATFNVSQYKNAYTDLQTAFGDNWNAYVEHYFTNGVNENRTAGVYGIVTRIGNTVATSTTPTVISTASSQEPVLENSSTIYGQVYNKIATLDINDDAAVKDLDNYVRANINAIISEYWGDGEWGWTGSVDFGNGNMLIIENQKLISEDRFMLVLQVADSVKVYKGIDCYGGYSKVYSWDAGKAITRTIYTDGVISGNIK